MVLFFLDVQGILFSMRSPNVSDVSQTASCVSDGVPIRK
jgi:hypothetical protein